MNRKKYSPCQVKAVDEQAMTIDFVLTTKQVDRDGEVVVPSGVRMDNFLSNPVFLWAHSRTAPPIGKVLTETIRQNEKEITATVQFDDEDPVAVSIFNKYKKGVLNAGSISFIPLKTDAPILDGQRGRTYTESELLEFSGVPIPANPHALAKAYEDVDELPEIVNQFFLQAPDLFKTVGEGTMEVSNAWCEYLTETAATVQFDDDAFEFDAKTLEDVESKFYSLNNFAPRLAKGSYEWVANELRVSAGNWLVENNSVGAIREGVDFVVLLATFKSEAMVGIIGMDRSFADDLIFIGKWKDNEAPVWKGKPKAADLETQVVTRMLKSRMADSVAVGDDDYDDFEDLSAAMLKHLIADEAPTREKEFFLLQSHYWAQGLNTPLSDKLKSFNDCGHLMIELVTGMFDMTDEDKVKLYEHLCERYSQFGKEPPEFGLAKAGIEDEVPEAPEEVSSDDMNAIADRAMELFVESLN